MQCHFHRSEPRTTFLHVIFPSHLITAHLNPKQDTLKASVMQVFSSIKYFRAVVFSQLYSFFCSIIHHQSIYMAKNTSYLTNCLLQAKTLCLNCSRGSMFLLFVLCEEDFTRLESSIGREVCTWLIQISLFANQVG